MLMKAAVLYPGGGAPFFTDVPEPVPQNDKETLVTVKAVAIKHLDKSRASGKHYSSDAQYSNAASGENGRVIGGDGVCLLEDGTRVYGMGVSGMLAEKATIDKSRIVALPDGLDDATAAALPNAVIGAAMALKFKADIQPGDVVMINGATGFTGRVAVQIARHYGAKKIIATGRNPVSLNELISLGADEILPVTLSDEDFKTRIADLHARTPIDLIIDYLWGHSAEMILTCLKGDGSFTNRIRYVSVGSVTGDLIQLSAANLRSVDLQLSGSGLGAWSKAQVRQLFSEILPEMFQLAATGRLKVQTSTTKLADIAAIWNLQVPDGRRLVVTI
jgi:NADPH:quinone reductase-like Zn-dependent oxidoreductase